MNPDELSVMQVKTCSQFTISVPEGPARFAQGGQQKHRPMSKKPVGSSRSEVVL